MNHRTLLLVSGLLVTSLASAGDFPDFGLSDTVVHDSQAQPEDQVSELLRKQAKSDPDGQSELSAQMFVDAQDRIAETFRRPVPDTLNDQSSDQ